LLYFFLSHAAGDDDSYAQRFFRDLSAEVRACAGVEGEVGFLDLDAYDNGRHWPSAVEEAVTTCRVFVALCSPRYFLSERCGREWTIFDDRRRRYQEATGRTAPALIPIVWTNFDAPPRNLDGPDQQAVLPDSPGDEGLRLLVRLRSWREPYRDFLAGLAHRIVETAHAHPISAAGPGPDLAATPSAFGHPDQTAPRIPVNNGEPSSSTQRVHFVVAAGTRAEMDTVREDLRYYGQRGEDWAPYQPSLSEPIAARARVVAAERSFGSEIVDLEGLDDRIESANRNNDIVVLLVDAWATKIDAYRNTLSDFDGRADPTVAVLVPSNRDDAESTRHRGELRADVSTTFRNAVNRRDQLLRTDIETVGVFDDDLMSVIEEAQNRIYSRGRIFRRPLDTPSADRPILEGP